MSLSVWCYLLGVVLALSGIVVWVWPERAAASFKAFPRNMLAGRILSTIAWIWAVVAVLQMGLDFLTPPKIQTVIILLGIAGIPLSWYWLDNLLACRALGGIYTLFPYELLHVARIHPSPMRLVVITLAYVIIIWGMVLILYPWKLRQFIDWQMATPARMKGLAAIRIAIGVVVLALGATALR